METISRQAPATPARVVADRLHSAAIHLLRRLRVEDKAMGLTPTRASALSVLVFRGPVTMSELAEAEQVRRPTITRLVDGLERRGLVRRVTDPADGRVQLVEATAAGKRLLQKGRARRVERLMRGVTQLSQDDQQVLARAADLMEESLLVTFDASAP
jgi:DNA-binding MarR family transcriptional regulator